MLQMNNSFSFEEDNFLENSYQSLSDVLDDKALALEQDLMSDLYAEQSAEAAEELFAMTSDFDIAV